MHRFFGEGQGQQVIQVAVIAAIAEVLAVQGHLVVIEEDPHLPQEFDVQWRGAAQGQGQAMTGQRIALGQGPQRRAVGAADADPVLRCDFEKVEMAGRGGQQVLDQAATQAEPGAGPG
ncbi:hypothetical protein D3C73_1262350 [compost metagenome]